MRVSRGRSQPDTVDTLSEESKLIRAIILHLLYDQADWLAGRIIHKTIAAYTDTSGGKLGMHLGYLEEEDLIESERRKLGAASFDFFRIKPRGIDVHEGTITHPGVGMRPE